MAGSNPQERQTSSQEEREKPLQSNSQTSLPFEIRLMIAELVIQEEERARERARRMRRYQQELRAQQEQRTARMLQLVAACAEWQTIIEKETFSSLKLQSVAEILRLGRIVDRRRERYIKRIRLHVELADYDHEVCQLAENEDTIRLNNQIFSQHLISLLNILSQWNDSSGVTLDLSAASRSDALHSFDKLETDVDDFKLVNVSPIHDWRLGARKRTLGSLLDLVSHDNVQVVLPRVPAVARFILTRRHFRSLSLKP